MENEVIKACRGVIYGDESNVTLKYKITNNQRTFGATLSFFISKKYQEDGLPEGKSIDIFLEGCAGQSFGAFLVNGVTLTLEGDVNDYLCKGLSGGTVIVYPPKNATYKSEENVIAGDTFLLSNLLLIRHYFKGLSQELQLKF